MRVSCRKDDPGFDNWRVGHVIYFNGKKLNQCITADDTEGWVLIYKTDENGKLLQRGNRTLIEETLHGNVEIKIEGDAYDR